MPPAAGQVTRQHPHHFHPFALLPSQHFRDRSNAIISGAVCKSSGAWPFSSSFAFIELDQSTLRFISLITRALNTVCVDDEVLVCMNINYNAGERVELDSIAAGLCLPWDLVSEDNCTGNFSDQDHRALKN
jgi:hypothetical protein